MMKRNLALLAGAVLVSLVLAACGEKSDQLTPAPSRSP
jgi:nitrous oxide reductase accessory protein NosL